MRVRLEAVLLPVVLAAGGVTRPETCAPCHAEIVRKQTGSPHAQALRPNADGRFAAEMQWAFGAGRQGITPVGVFDGVYFESRLSYYPRAGGMALTFGHPERAETPRAKLGLAQDSLTITRCFSCHATGVRPGPDFSEMVAGITCERCHGPAQEHIAAAKAGAAPEKLRSTIVNPSRFPTKAQVEVCGECHRLPEPGRESPEPEIENPVSVRFAPIGLMASRCFVRSRKLSCLTCHDPHDNTRPAESKPYQERCRACHAGTVQAKSKCPRLANGECLGCHMQRTSLGPYLRFTDHRIRVYSGEPR